MSFFKNLQYKLFPLLLTRLNLIYRVIQIYSQKKYTSLLVNMANFFLQVELFSLVEDKAEH